MTTTSTTVMSGNQEPNGEQSSGQSPSRFTAVNGKEGTVPSTNGTAQAPNGASAETEKPQEILDNTRGTSGYNTPSSYQEERPTDRSNSAAQEQDTAAQSPLSAAQGPTTNGNNKNKRKRSESNDRQVSTPNTNQRHSIPRSPTSRSEDAADPNAHSSASNGAAQAAADVEATKFAQQSYSRRGEAGHNRTPSNGTPWRDYDPQLLNQGQRTQHLDSSDAQLAEALQRDVQGHDAAQKNWQVNDNRHSEESTSVDQQFANYAQERSQPPSASQPGPKRKRVFSNRTKTGCMTCRRRKKKCDEQHPDCNNCLRGGFLCEGYSSRNTWQKPSNAKGPVPLQSKDGYPEVPGQYVHEMSPQQRERTQSNAQVEGGKIRPIVVDEGERNPSQYITSPTGAGATARGSWSKRSWPGPGHPPYGQEHLPPKAEYRGEVPPIHELSRVEHAKNDYHNVPPIREMPPGNHARPGLPMFQGGVDQRPSNVAHMDTSSPQAQARMALSIEHQLSNRAATNEETEKEKMVRGELYRPFDIHLVEERERCKAALWRFNNAGNPVFGASVKEQNRLLKEILVPPVSTSANLPPGAPAPARSVGSIGQGAVVEAPFKCHYGYNIHIGEDVMISENCSLIDDCPINIGAHSWIGPNVSILGSMAHASMQERKGSQSRYEGRPVTIEEDCWIGAGCIIYPGVRLRRGAYVAPGEIVKTDIVAYGFQGLKPSYM